MAGALAHTRNLKRRLLAAVIDFVLVSLFFTLLMLPFATSPDSTIRLSEGMIHSTNCAAGDAYNTDGALLSKEGWDEVTVCEVISNGFFPKRTATFHKKLVEGAWTYEKSVSLPIDSRNRITAAYYLDGLVWLLFLTLAALFEASRKQATPGKLLLGLKVVSRTGQGAGIVRALARNILKYPIMAAGVISGAITMALPVSHSPMNFVDASNRVHFPDDMFGMAFMGNMVLLAGLSILQLAMFLTLVFPQRTTGRALYDWWAGTMVVSHPEAETASADQPSPGAGA